MANGVNPPPVGGETYAGAGVDVNAGYEAVRRIKPLAAATFRPEVLGGLGGFGGCCALPAGYHEPVLVSGTDGVGTKILVAQRLGRHDTIGEDCVAMCVNDVAAQGAEPLFFLDYLALGKLDPALVAEVVKGVAEGCRKAGCALIGGETAEMPGLYAANEYDLAGFTVGVAERSSLLAPEQVQAGDVLVGVASSGLHSNGFSLVRRLVFDVGGFDLAATPAGLERSLGEELLMPTRIYAKALLALRRAAAVHGVAHITGGGFYENIPRILPAGLGALINLGSWEVPPIFGPLVTAGVTLGHHGDRNRRPQYPRVRSTVEPARLGRSQQEGHQIAIEHW